MNEVITKVESGTSSTTNARGGIRPGTLLAVFCLSFCTVFLALVLLPTPAFLDTSAACCDDEMPTPRAERTVTTNGAEPSAAAPVLCSTV